MQANNISEVIHILNSIITDCQQRKSRLGYFAVLYKLMTEAVLKGIQQNRFSDAARMEKLDTVFANRYLKAYDDHIHNQPVSLSWKTAFDAAEQNNLIVVQHLLLGINAHINLDLGIAAADICTPDSISNLQADFVAINDTIADVYGTLQPCFSKISWPAVFLDRLNPRVVNNTINFSIVKAREVAWANALLLCHGGENKREEIIKATDNVVVKVAQAIAHPAAIKNFALKIILLFERKDIGKNIDLLSGN
jgi:hypothetical protein